IPHLKVTFDDILFDSLHYHWRESIILSEGGLGIENAYQLLSWKKESEQFQVSMDSHGGPLYRRQILKSKEGYLNRSAHFAGVFFSLVNSPLLNSEFLSVAVKEN